MINRVAGFNYFKFPNAPKAPGLKKEAKLSFGLQIDRQRALEQKKAEAISKASRPPEIESLLKQAQASKTTIQVETLRSKLLSGQSLTPDELSYLKEHAPDLYAKAVKIAAERKEFEKKLDRCKTKEEVRKLKMDKTAGIVSGMAVGDSKAARDTNETISMRVSAISDAYYNFTQTGKYKSLPEKDKKTLNPINAKVENATDVILNEKEDKERKIKIDEYV